MNLYPCLCEIRGSTPRWQTPEQLIVAANAGEDPIAVETLQVFAGWLGSLIGDLVIAFGARSVYLAGGISAHIENFLRAPAFRERYFNKGVLGHVLRHVPIWRVDHGQLGIVGAAAWHADHHSRG
jgi:glucokinase